MKNKLEIKNIIYLIVFIFFNLFALVEFLLRRILGMNFYNLASFFINYKNGFVSRGLIGTLFSIFPDKYMLNAVIIVSAIEVIIFTIFILSQVFHIFMTKIDDSICLWFLFAVSSSTVIHFMFREAHLKMELFWYLLFIPVFLGFLDLKKHRILNSIILLLFSVLSILIHQAFIFVIAPFIMIMLIESDEKILLFFYVFIIGITFLICQFFGKGDYELILIEAYVKAKNVFKVNLERAWYYIHKMLFLEYNSSVFEHFKILKDDFIKDGLRLFLLTISFNIFNIFILFQLFIHVYKKKIKFYLPFLIISQIPLYVLAIDYDRWIIMFLLNMQILIMLKLRKGDKIEIKEPPKFMDKLYIINIFLILFFQYFPWKK